VQTVANPVDVVVQRKMLQGLAAAGAARVGAAAGGAPGAPAPAAAAAAGALPPAAAAAGADARAARVLSAREIARDVLRSRGVKGFFSGFFISCAQFVPSASLWWYSYPHLQEALHALAARAGADGEGGAGGAPPSPAFCRAVEVLSGSLASAIVAVTLNPVDLVRTRTQVEGSAALAVLRRVLAEEGVRGLWKGVLPRMAMLVPQGALSVSAYELVKRMAQKPQLA